MSVDASPSSPRRRTRLHDERGAVYVFAALMTVVLVLSAGLVVDLGQQRAAARDAQADADVIALDLSRLAGPGTTVQALNGGSNPAVRAELDLSAERNGIVGTAVKNPPGDVDVPISNNPGKFFLVDGSTLKLELQWGFLSPDTASAECSGQLPSGEVDQHPTNDEPGAPIFTACTVGTETPNAARVSAYDHLGFTLLPVGDGPGEGRVVRTAIARQGGEELVSFRIGSYLLDGVDEGLLDDIFTELLGSSVDLQAVHYDGLLLHHITIAQLAELTGTTGTPSEVLAQEITFQQLADATIESLRRDGDGTLTDAQITAIESIFAGATVVANEPIRLGDLVEADPTDPDSALDAQLTALDVLQSGAHLSQCTQDVSGNWDCHSIMFDNLAASLAGIATVSAPVTTVTESPRVYVGNEVGATLQTSQISTSVDLDFTSNPGTVGNCGLLGLNCLLQNLLGSLLGNFSSIALLDVTGSVSVDLVGGRATIQDLCYNAPATRNLDLMARTSLYDAEARIDLSLQTRTLLGATSPFTISLIVSNTDPANSQPVTFTDPDAMGPVNLGGGTVGLSGLDVAVEVKGTLLPDGLAGLQPLWNALVNNTLLPLVNNLTSTLTDTIVPHVDTLVGELSDRLGINLTGADLEGLFNRCGDYGVQLVG